MRVAVCLFGFLRSFKLVEGLFKTNLIDPWNADVFIACPNTFYADRQSDDQLNGKDNPEPATREYFEQVFGERLKGCELYAHDFNLYKQKVAQSGIPPKNKFGHDAYKSYSMFDSIRKVLLQRKEYEQKSMKQYDVVVLSRPDIEIVKKVEIDKVDLSKVTHSVSHGASAWGMVGDGPAGFRLFGDHLLVSRAPNMDSFIELYDTVRTLYRQGVMINNETLMAFFLKYKGIDFDKSQFVFHGVIR